MIYSETSFGGSHSDKAQSYAMYPATLSPLSTKSHDRVDPSPGFGGDRQIYWAETDSKSPSCVMIGTSTDGALLGVGGLHQGATGDT